MMRPVGKENVWMSFKGIKNSDMKVEMMSMPTRMHPAAKGELVNIEGRDGKLWISDGAYDQSLITVQLMTMPDADIDSVNAWLDGSGMLIFGDEPDRAYRAQVTKQFARSNRIMRMRSQVFDVSFDCEPHRYAADPGDPIAISASGYILINPGTADALPLIRVNGYGDGTLMVSGSTMIFNGLTGYVMVDNDAEYIYTGSGTAADPYLGATDKAMGDWIRIPPGNQPVSWTGGITSIEITPRWRWLS